MKNAIPAVFAGVFVFSSVFFASCNAFNFVDGPSKDPQLLSAARACFDQGDFECARQNYAKLSSDQADVAASESAFSILDQAGIQIATLASAVTSFKDSAGQAITKMANSLVGTAGQATRVQIFNAYSKAQSINRNRSKDLRGLVRFVTAAALIAELLAEDAGVSGKFQKADLVADPQNCTSLISCAATSACSRPSGKKLVNGPKIQNPGSSDVSLDYATVDQVSPAPTLNLIAAAISSVNNAITNDISDNGTVGSSLSSFSNDVLSQAVSADAGDAPCFRFVLLRNGIGAP